MQLLAIFMYHNTNHECNSLIQIIDMKQLSIFAILIIWIMPNISAQSLTTTFGDEILSGRIKTLTERNYKYQGDSLTQTYELIHNFDYNTGKQLSRIGLGQHITRTYNDSGLLIKYIIGRDGEIDCPYVEYTYDDRGNLLEMTTKYPPNTLHRTYPFDYFMTRYDYDDDNNLIKKQEWNKYKGKREVLTNQWDYRYDSLGNCVYEEFRQYGKLIETKNNKYSTDRQLTEVFTWMNFEEEDLYIRDLYAYNADKTILSHTNICYYYGSTDEISNLTQTDYQYKYDEALRLINESRITKSQFANYNKTASDSLQYLDFDINNNWTRKITNNSEGKSEIIRTIEYY